MRIEFDPTNPTEAEAVRAMLTAMAPTPQTGDSVQWQGASFRIVEDTLDGDEVANAPTIELSKTDATEPSEPSQDPELDSNEEPHDPRIHSTPATTNKDGTWRAKRGVTADQIAQVRAEREAQATEDAHIAIIDGAGFDGHDEQMTNGYESGEVVRTEGGPISPDQEISSNEGAPEVFTPTPSAPPAPPVTAAPPAPIATGAPSFLDVMKAITAAQKDGKIDTAKVKELCAAVGAGESTMGLNGPDNGDKRVAFMALLAEETK